MVVCGLGGTVIKDLRYLYQPFFISLKKYGVTKEHFPNNSILNIYGKDKFIAIHEIINQVYSNEKKRIKVIQDIYRDNINKNHIVNDYPEKAEFINSNIPETLFNMRKNGIKVVLTSSYPNDVGNKIIKDLNLQSCFDNYLFDNDPRFSTNKPSIERIRFFMKQFNIKEPNQILKIGSNINDIIEANLIPCGVNIAVLTGYEYENELLDTGADYLINDLSNIISDKSNYLNGQNYANHHNILDKQDL